MVEFKRLPFIDEKKPILRITQKRLDWITANHHRFTTENELINEMIEDNSGLFCKFNKEKAKLLLKVFYGEAVNMSNNYSPKEKDVKIIGGEYNKCYLCNNENKIERHHISYCPEIIVLVCTSCHRKIHFISDEYHQKEKIFRSYLTTNDKLSDFTDYCDKNTEIKYPIGVM